MFGERARARDLQIFPQPDESDLFDVLLRLRPAQRSPAAQQLI